MSTVPRFTFYAQGDRVIIKDGDRVVGSLDYREARLTGSALSTAASHAADNSLEMRIRGEIMGVLMKYGRALDAEAAETREWIGSIKRALAKVPNVL